MRLVQVRGRNTLATGARRNTEQSKQMNDRRNTHEVGDIIVMITT